MDQQAYWAIGLFLVSYALIVSEKIHRTIIAMLGGLLMVVTGIISQEAALHHIDFNTLGLLAGMMILVNLTAETGLFRWLGIQAVKKAKGQPVRVMLYLSIITALGSAFLDNVTTVMLMVPVSLSIARQLGVNPLPLIITQILASNIGGTATLIGDPPNIMIGSAVKELTFMAFIINLAPVAAAIMAVHLPLFAWIFRKQLRTTPERMQAAMEQDLSGIITDPKLLRQCLTVLGLTIVGFFLHQVLHLDSATVALAGAFLLLLLTGEHKMEEALARVEWTTLFFFIGLFALVGGLVETGVLSELASRAIDWTGGETTSAAMLILWVSAVASAFLDNIPFVAAMIPLIQDMGAQGVPDLEPLWWSLALGACLGGNGSLIGASANLVAAGLSAKEGHPIRFVPFLLIGFPLMLLSTAIATLYVYLRYLL